MAGEFYTVGPLHFAYGTDAPCLAIDRLEIEKGRVTVLAGENGSGKTTLLKLLSGLLGANGQKRQDPDLSRVASDAVYLHQTPYLFHGTVGHNLRLALGAPPDGADSSDSERLMDAALEKVGLPGYADRRARSLSGGEGKRVALARVFLSRRQLLLLDEPAAHVDDNSMRLIERACRDFADAGRTVVVATHRGSFGYRVADRMLDLREGRLEANSSNILKGEVVRHDSGFLHFRSDGAEFRAPMRDGSYRVAVIAGEDIILSRHPLDSSARNCMAGSIVSMDRRTNGVLSVRVDCGMTLCALITDAAAADLELKPGADVFATFKASSVRLY